MTAACNKSFKVRNLSKTSIGNKSVPWWMRELTTQRNKLNVIRWRYQQTKQTTEGSQERAVSAGEKEV
jgi:hypothetical protein